MRIFPARATALVVALLGTAPAAATAQATAVVGTVYDSLVTRQEMREATVTIVELNRTVTSDSHGRFRFDSVPTGTYRITFFHRTLDSLELAAPIALLEVPPAGMVNARLATPSPATAYARLCPGVREAATGVAFGRVRDVDDGRVVGGALINAEWNEWLIGGGRAPSRKVERATARTSAAGAYVLCGVPIDVAVDVRAVVGNQGAGPVPIQAGPSLLARRDFAVSRRDPAARVAVRDSGRIVHGDATAPLAGSAIVTGIVRTPDGRTHSDALIGVSGTAASTRTSQVGRFRVPGVPAGTRTIEVRAIGYTPATVIVDLPTGGALDTTIALDRRPQTLAALSVVAKGEPSDRTGFAARKKMGFGTFMTAEQIQREQPQDVVSALAMSPTIERGWAGTPGRQGEVITMRGGGGGRCTPNIFVDNVQFEVSDASSMGDLNSLAHPNQIKGIEIYPGPIIPFQFDRTIQTGCGSIVIWTR